MVVLAIAGVVTAFTERPFLMILIFLFSFFPGGLYLLGVPSIFRLIGLSDLFFFLSSILILLREKCKKALDVIQRFLEIWFGYGKAAIFQASRSR
jgi:hypothetical protein